MNPDTFQKVMTFAENRAPYFIATVDRAGRSGQPHIAAAGELTFADNGSGRITDWFCLTTINNLRTNPGISVLIWDREKDAGYQLLGEAEKIEDIAMMNGYSPELDEKKHLPQVERMLYMRIRKILSFSQRGQSDMEE